MGWSKDQGGFAVRALCWGCLCLALAGIFVAVIPPSSSQLSSIRSTGFENAVGSSLAVNETFAFDADLDSFAYFTLETGSVDYFPQNGTGHADTEDIKRVDLSFNLAVSGTTNDRWALEYSADNGSTWTALRASATGDLARQALVYQDINNSGLAKWTWSNITELLRLRVITAVQGGLDHAQLQLYDLEVNVTSDVEGPGIVMVAPIAAANLSNASVTFDYLPNDALSGIANCTLEINGTANLSNVNVQNGMPQNFTQAFQDGLYLWDIVCWDNASAQNSNRSSPLPFLVDTQPPQVMQVDPPGGFAQNDSKTVVFTFNVTDASSIANCSLLINQSINLTSTPISPGVNQTFSASFPNGVYAWSVQCADSLGWQNATPGRVLAVNYADAPPTVNSMSVPAVFDLNAGTTKPLNCTALVQDNNSASEIGPVNATLFASTSQSAGNDSNFTHYTNAACGCVAVDATRVNCTCAFQVYFVAQNGSWTCNVSARSVDSLHDAYAQAPFSITPLYAINISDGIDFGAVDAMQVSSNVSVAIENLGNNDIGVNVIGYGMAIGDGWGFVCASGQNVSIDSVHFTDDPSLDYSQKQVLNGSVQPLGALRIPRAQDPGSMVANFSYWQAQAPVTSKGDCVGNVVFLATP